MTVSGVVTTGPPDTAPLSAIPRGRLLALLAGGLALLMGVWTGLARAGVHDPAGPVASHGVLMVLGFLGTLVALERAVALRRRWAYAAPAASGAAVVCLTLGWPPVIAGVLLVAAGVVVVAASVVMLRQHVAGYLGMMAGGAVAWVLAAALWTAGWSPVRLAPILAAFLVLTILGERLELSRLRSPSPRAVRRLAAVVALFAGGALLTLVHRRTGLVVAGAGLLGQTIWFWRHDIARVTVHRPGVPRFAGACLLAGYVWLAASGVLWIALGAGVGGSLLHDAALHTLFLGFVMSMVMGHAPVILPAVLRTPLRVTRLTWVPVVLLHLSVAVRVAADLGGSSWLRGLAAHGNVSALLLFVVVAAVGARRGRRRSTAAR